MATVRDLLMHKGAQVFTVPDSMSVLEATQHMNEHKIGALLVLQTESGLDGGRPRLMGMFTERDVLRRVVAEARDPARSTVGEVMTTDVLTCSPDTSVDEAALLMKDQRVRHLPVFDHGGELCGLVSIGDINAYHVRDQEATIHTLHEYIHGRV